MKKFDLRDPDVLKKIINAASPQNFDPNETYFLANPRPTRDITKSMRTLTILAISAEPSNLYTELFEGWKVADADPLTFHRQTNDAIVLFYPDWKVQVHIIPKRNDTFIVSKTGVFECLKKSLQNDPQ